MFTAMIADTCGDYDCGGCCSANAAETGYLVDLEYFTLMRNFGDTSFADGNIEFYIDELPPSNVDDSYGELVNWMDRIIRIVTLVAISIGALCGFLGMLLLFRMYKRQQGTDKRWWFRRFS